jgi:hypothetical protein
MFITPFPRFAQNTQTLCIFNTDCNNIVFILQKKKSAKIKCLLYRPKPQKFHTAEITDYTVYEEYAFG